jgi:integrase
MPEATWLKQGGEDSLVVARLLGHTSTTMIERVYGHLSQEN